MVTWKKQVVSCPGYSEEVRYITFIPVIGQMVLRQDNVRSKGRWTKGRWHVGKFGEAHAAKWLRPKTAKGAKAAAKRWFRKRLKEALKAVG